ncbi:unnamed protein product [Sphagnum jensenii]|uniref:Major facilitator superfamily (MFS) profile domain-containing protein n=1 Tax=Sphagnum jensenii TaxID=128206 RepID=A0ABP0W3B0_9BRYO
MAFGAGNSVSASGGAGTSAGVKQYEGRITIYVVFASILAASSALMAGYDNAITGGVAQMRNFLEKFFPVVYANEQLSARTRDNHSIYCQYNNQPLQAYVASISLAGAVSTLFASYFTRNYGRKSTLLFSGAFFIIGVILKTSAQNLGMLLVGRIITGFGSGFANQAAPIYLCEIAPLKWRGKFGFFFQISIAFGNLIACVINYSNARTGNAFGWRSALGLEAIPAILVTVGALFISETPNSLVQRGYREQGKKTLQRIRGTQDVEVEFDDILIAAKKSPKQNQCAEVHQLNTITMNHVSFSSSFKNVLKSRTSRPPLIISCLIQFFATFASGSIGMAYYALILISTLHFKITTLLFWSMMLGIILLLGTMVGSMVVDKLGRKQLLILGNFFMFISLIALAILLSTGIRDGENLSPSLAPAIILFICMYIAAIAVSWEPLAWSICSEIFPLETRSAGLSFTIFVRFIFTFLTLETNLSMLCSFKWGLFLFFAMWVVVAQVFVFFLLPETKGVPLDEMEIVWRRHWFWKRFMPLLDIECENLPKKQGT